MDDHTGPRGETREVAVLFADLVGFTALTEAHGDEEAARAAIRLLELTHAAYDGQAVLVKSIGDGVMVVFDDVDAAVSAGLGLSHAALVEPRFLGLRVGIDAGSAVQRHGDVFGATVNLASRVADEAAAGQVLVTGAVRDRLDRAADLELAELGPTSLRHVRDPVDLVEVREAGRVHDVAVDPVCRMQVPDEAPEAVEQVVAGRTVRFCSRPCARLFAEHPDAYR